MTQRERIRKALESGDSSSYIGVLEQPAIDAVIADLINYKNPLRLNVPRKRGEGKAWRCHRRSAAANTPTYWITETTNTTGSTWIDDSSYELLEFTYKTLFAKGRVTRFYQAIGRSYMDILAEEIEARAIDFKNAEDYAMVAGSSTSTTNAVSGAMPSGLAELLDMYDSGSQVIRTEDSSSTGGTSLTLTKLDELIDKCKGEPDMLIMSKKSRRIVQGLLQVSQRFVDKVKVNGGFSLMTYAGIPIFVSTNIGDNEWLKSDNTVGTTTNSSYQSSSIYAVNIDEFFVAELTPVTIKPLAKTSSQYDDFEIYCDETFVLRDPLTCARLAGVKE
ncbi:hypothetical protein J7M02_03385 [Candidatus Aerophobetes bacterium]|nr:hypothetical protein [Candidatus Aerophobetes bacterium]